jgi:predicted transcriptional regulator
MTKPIVDRAGLTEEQLDLIQQFEADYNTVDHFLRKVAGANRKISSVHLVNEYSRSHPGWRDAELLKTIADVRNAIVHGKIEAYSYVAVPTPVIAQKLIDCRDRLINPALAIPKFQRKVERVSIDESLGQVLRIISKRDYSQFPAYEGERFKGLLTENGITRWLAHHVDTSLSLIDLDDVPVTKVLAKEDDRKNHRFVARATRVDDVSSLFAAHALLEAVLITATGKETEALLGIATRWDIIHRA